MSVSAMSDLFPIPPAIQQELSAAAMFAGSARVQAFKAFIRDAAAAVPPSVERLKAVYSYLHNPNLPLSIAREILMTLVSTMVSLPTEQFMDVASNVLTCQDRRVAPRVFAFDPSVLRVRERTSAELEQAGEYQLAADHLSRITGEMATSPPNNLSDFSILHHNLRIARLYIKAGAIDRAQNYCNRSNQSIAQSEDFKLITELRFCLAMILHAKGRYGDAAIKYYTISQSSLADELMEDGMTDRNGNPSLLKAVKCTILAPAGPRRSRMLDILYKDERSRTLDVFKLLQSFHRDRLVLANQIDQFRDWLIWNESEEVLQRAIAEHNLIAASRLYSSIRMAELGALLGITGEEAERVAAKMVCEKRLSAQIDQVDGAILFETSEGKGVEGWDNLVANWYSAIDACVDDILQEYPGYDERMRS